MLTTFFLRTIFGLKDLYFLPNIASNMLKDYDFANIGKISFIFKQQQNKKKKIFFPLWPAPPPYFSQCRPKNLHSQRTCPLRTLAPPPQALKDIMNKNVSFFLLHVCIQKIFSSFIFPLHKNLHFISGQGFCPPPLNGHVR